MERIAFIRGFERALSFGAGFCTLCTEWPAEKLAEPNIFCKKKYIQPQTAWLPVGAVVIDVFTTARRNGFEIETAKGIADNYKLFGLLVIK